MVASVKGSDHIQNTDQVVKLGKGVLISRIRNPD
jgi:hypothetical protein